MGTLPLLTASKSPNGSHHIKSPGGYEIWHFYAEDSSQRLRTIISLHDGYIASPDYRRKLTAYRDRPTINAPPVPSQFPCLQASIFESGKLLKKLELNFPPGSFQETEDGSITLGNNCLAFSSDEIKLSATSPESSTSINLSFRPRLFPTTPEIITNHHHWLPTSPLCEVSGQIDIAEQKITLAGLGQHNHCYATKPPNSPWIRGGIIFPHVSASFQVMGDRSAVVVADDTGFRTLENVPFTTHWTQRLFSSQPHPSEMQFCDWLILRNPKIATTSPFEMQLFFDAYLNGELGNAWVEIFRP